jgi:hypothetical protein
VDWSEGAIARAIGMQTLARKCVVLVDRCAWTGYECDVLAVTNDLRIIDVEIKISRADLKADRSKDKWWHRHSWMRHGPDAPRMHPRKVWKHYFAMPAEVWKPELAEFLPSAASGILLVTRSEPPQPGVLVRCLRRATPAKDADRLTPAQVMDIARLANLRMWEAYKTRDEAVGRASKVAAEALA